MVKIEISHDALAKRVYEKASFEDRTRLKAERLVKEAYYNYTDRGTLLDKENLLFINPYLSTLNIKAEHQQFIYKSNFQLQKKRWYTIGISALFIFLLVGLSGWAFTEHQNALEKEKENKALALGNASDKALEEGDHRLAFRLAKESWELFENRSAQRTIYQLLNSSLSFSIKHEDEITAIDFSKDSDEVLTASKDGTAKLWDLNGRLLNTFNHRGHVNFATFSPNGKLIGSISEDTILQIWTNSESPTLSLPHTNKLSFLQFNGSTDYLITGSYDKVVHLWYLNNLQSKTRHITLKHQDFVSNALFSPNGEFIYTTTSQGNIVIWDLSGQRLKTIKAHQATISSLQFSISGNKFITTSLDSSVRVWNKHGQSLLTLELQEAVKSATISPNERNILVVEYESKVVSLWDSLGNNTVRFEHISEAKTALFSPNSKEVITLAEDNTVKLWNIYGKEIAAYKHQQTPNKALFSPNGKYVFSSSASDYTAKLWHINHHLIHRFQQKQAINVAKYDHSEKYIIGVSGPHDLNIWNRDGQLIADFSISSTITDIEYVHHLKQIHIATKEGYLEIWDLEGNQLKTFRHGRAIRTLDLSNNQNLLLVNKGKTANITNVLTWEQPITLSHNKPIHAATFAHQAENILTASLDSTVKLWGLNGQLLHTYEHNGYVIKARFAKDDQCILTAVKGKKHHEAVLWSKNGNRLVILKHDKPITTIAIAPNSQLLATGSEDKKVRIWTKEGRLLQILSHHDEVTQLAFLSDSEHLLSASKDNTVQLWNKEGLPIQRFQHDKPIEHLSLSEHTPDEVLTAAKDGRIAVWQLYTTPQSVIDYYDNRLDELTDIEIRAYELLWAVR